MIRILIMQALFALTFPIGKLGLQYTGALFLTGIRMVLAGLLMLAYVTLFEKKWPKVPRADWYLFFKTSLFYVYLSFVPEFWALESMSSLKSNMMWSSFPFVSALLSFVLLGERLTQRQWVGMTIGLLGMVPIIVISEDQFVCDIWRISWPEVAMCLVVFSTAYAWFLIKQLMDKGYSLPRINGITMFLGGLMSLATRMVVGTHEPLYTNFGATLFYALVLVLISNIIGYSLYGHLLRKFSITFLSFTGFLCPIFGIIFGKLFFNEHVQPAYLAAFGCIIAGLFLFYRDELLEASRKS